MTLVDRDGHGSAGSLDAPAALGDLTGVTAPSAPSAGARAGAERSADGIAIVGLRKEFRIRRTTLSRARRRRPAC